MKDNRTELWRSYVSTVARSTRITLAFVSIWMPFLTSSALAEFEGCFTRLPSDAQIEVTPNGQTIRLPNLDLTSNSPPITATFNPSGEARNENEFTIGTLLIDVSTEVSFANKGIVYLSLTGVGEGYQGTNFKIPLRFRSFPSADVTQTHVASVQFLDPSPFPLVAFADAQQRLELQVGSSLETRNTIPSESIRLESGSNELTLTGKRVPLSPFNAQLAPSFASPRGTPEKVVSGQDTPILEWGKPFAPETRGNRIEISTLPASGQREVPFKLGTFSYYNSTISDLL